MCVRLDLSFRTDLIKTERVPLLLCVLSSASLDVSGEKSYRGAQAGPKGGGLAVFGGDWRAVESFRRLRPRAPVCEPDGSPLIFWCADGSKTQGCRCHAASRYVKLHVNYAGTPPVKVPRFALF
jgi:hypothetical protein